ncbi:anti-sigma factor family protein [Streptomyces sp. NPDC101149]|uniref:anti-sigma factor family protein n=1 Tax=Streptomyces sp. NPDC101149 TaxID=3366113 RepID=UPI00380590A6
MTSTTDAAGHPDVEELSDLSEGLLQPSRTGEVRRHLEGCALCSDVYDSLEEIRSILGAAPEPSPMPDDVAERIDAALAAQALLDATTPAAGDTPSAGPAAAHVSRETSPSSMSGRPSGRAAAATGPGRSPRKRRTSRRTVAFTAVLTISALGLGTFLVQTLGNDSGKTPSTAIGAQTDAAHTYSEGTLQSQVTTLLSGEEGGSARPESAKPWGIESADGNTGSSGLGHNKTFGGTTVTVPSCIEQAIRANQTVLASDEGVYQGTVVYLVLTPDASDSTRVTAYIVDATCVKQASATPGKVLLTQSYPRS